MNRLRALLNRFEIWLTVYALEKRRRRRTQPDRWLTLEEFKKK